MSAEAILKKLRLDKATSCLIVNAPKEYIAMLDGIAYDAKPVKKKEGS